ncbi:hypothetical protein HWV00_11420 [Moritella sp. 24]|uniref:hypothetical protein n=1 Tax=Moritella sp. 24 TaxID=2746230 RepID=UPI001BA9892F|nr:hypothetical protein [Moritella sp. 24]QUM76795.1 hypothetical protein HWV00_11420 [Moritella sp. 24]
MKKSILLMSFLFSGATLANDSCRGITPGGSGEELDYPSITVLGNGNIYANGNMQAKIRVDYKAQAGFSLMDITLCDYFEMTPIEDSGEWKVDEIENDYLHEIISSQPSNNDNPEDVNTNFADWIPFYDTRYLRTADDTEASADVCVVVTGMQSDGELIAKTSCIGDSVSTIHVAAEIPEPVEFELNWDKINDTNEHLSKVYELHSVDKNIQIHDIKYRNGASEATNTTLRVNSQSDFNVLRDTQTGERISSWVGVWAYDSSKVDTVEIINENSKSVGSFDLPTLAPPSSPSLITSFFLFQLHRYYYMIADNLCYKTGTGSNSCYNYEGKHSYPTGIGESDYRTNDLTITDVYGTPRSVSIKFGNGNDNDDLFIY